MRFSMQKRKPRPRITLILNHFIIRLSLCRNLFIFFRRKKNDFFREKNAFFSGVDFYVFKRFFHAVFDAKTKTATANYPNTQPFRHKIHSMPRFFIFSRPKKNRFFFREKNAFFSGLDYFFRV